MTFQTINKRIQFAAFLLLISANAALAQIHGMVVQLNADGQPTPVTGAFIHCLGETNGVFSDSTGHFELTECTGSKAIVADHISLKSDTLPLNLRRGEHYRFILTGDDATLNAIAIERRRKGLDINSLDPKTTINLREREFQKAACCNLSESFENAPAIDVSYADAVTGTRQIKMLGLDGFYTLISREYMSAVRTLNGYYGMSFIPAAWVDGIQITKGAGSVVNGYESIAGQINVELKKPFGKEKLLVDQFISESGRSETDVMFRKDISRKLATSLFVRGGVFPARMDRNNDGFVDNPVGNQFQALNRWQFQSGNWEGQFSAGANRDRKEAGQLSSKLNPYNINIQNDQVDLWAKLGRVFPDKPYKSFGSQYGYNHSKLRSTYGSGAAQKTYDARSQTFYMNLLYQSILGTTIHSYQTGVSVMADQMTEELTGNQTLQYDRLEVVPGAFFEYTYKPSDSLIIVAGVRSDYNSIYGFSVTPRIHSKYTFNKGKSSVRVSGGMGRRTSNILAQNQAILASNRTWVVPTETANTAYGLKQEVAVNTGISFHHDMKWGFRPASLIVDYFNTTFLHEVVFDREADTLFQVYNMANGTRANSIQIQLDYEPFRRTEIRLAYRAFGVQTKYRNIYTVFQQGGEGYLEKPFVAPNRAFINVTQTTRKNWQFSSTLQWYDRQRTTQYFRMEDSKLWEPDYSPFFFLLNVQVSKKIHGVLEVFAGAENLLNYKQENPIQGSDDPYGKTFDASLVWGPVFGRMMYGGLRYRIND
ncbi:MAG: hypothetical protein H6608_01420 [Flavobacteriales bacterium]|nr:hypothetical protein [Bacteroidota bacterium]MCB9239766.1 hypothetical protein [Flavobacteriales bacterium]